MKVLHINTNDISGGAARAVYRLHCALLAHDIDSQLLVQNKQSDDFTILGAKTKLEKFINILRPSIEQIPVKFYKNKKSMLFSPAWLGFSGVAKKINELNPDIVHLHWVCGGMLKIEEIAKIKAPIVWSLHDMWAFTDGYHYDDEFDLFVEKKIQIDSLKSSLLCKRVLKRKQKTYNKKKDIIIVGLSKWLFECSKSSILLKNKKHFNLPNPINTDIYKPMEKSTARELWNLPKDKKLILFGAMGATSDPRKGFKQLNSALEKLEKIKNIELIVFGGSKPKNAPYFGFKAHYLGMLSDSISLMTLYNAVDLVVVPSLQENLSNVIMESLSCSTPVVGFDIGGNSDMIEHKINGYLVKPYDTKDLKNGIEWILNTDNYEQICNNAREKVLKNFSDKVVAPKYIKLYKSILNE